MVRAEWNQRGLEVKSDQRVNAVNTSLCTVVAARIASDAGSTDDRQETSLQQET